MGLSGDGSYDKDPSTHDGLTRCPIPPESTIYVALSDPIGTPAFRPSPAKPIPKWMQLPPDYPGPGRGPRPRPSQILEQAHGRPSSMGSPSSGGSTLCPTNALSTPVPSPTPTSRSSPESAKPHIVGVEAQSSKPSRTSGKGTTMQGIGYVSNERLKRPSSGKNRSYHNCNSDTTTSSAYKTPPEYPTYQHSPPRTNTPTDQGPRPGADENTSQSSRASLFVSSQQLASHLRRISRAPPPQQSSEYLERYQPVASPTRRQGPEQALQRTTSRRCGRAETCQARVVEETAQGGGDRPLLGRRMQLQVELRKLFGGR
jgi:hypothetical protein